jgi:hypothetical protein
LPAITAKSGSNHARTSLPDSGRNPAGGIPEADGHYPVPAGQGNRCTAAKIGEIIAGKRAVTVDTGLRLSRFFGMSDGFWIGLQTDYDTARAKDALADVLSRIQRYDSAHV